MTAREHAVRLATVVDAATAAEDLAARGEWIPALQQIHRTNELLVQATHGIVQTAYDAGETKTAIAYALEVPAGTFRGMTRTGEQ